MSFNHLVAIALASLLSASTSATMATVPAEFPIPRLKGLFNYQQNFRVPKIRRAETVSVETIEGEKRVKALKEEGYTCIRKNQMARLCSKIWTPTKTPEGLEKDVSKFMTPITVEFSGTATLPELIHDGSTTQEWQVSETIKVLQTELTVYHVVKTNKAQIFIVFPVSESQPMNPLLFHNENQLALSIIANTKDTEKSTLAYTIEAFLEKSAP